MSDENKSNLKKLIILGNVFQTSYLVKVVDGWGGSGYLYFSDSFQAVGVKIEN